MGVNFATRLAEPELVGIFNGVLPESLGEFGFRGVDVREEEDFDGEQVLRVVAHVDSRLTGAALMTAMYEAYEAIRSRGDARFVYLESTTQGAPRWPAP